MTKPNQHRPARGTVEPFVMIPTRIFEDPKLTLAAKNVFAAICDHLRRYRNNSPSIGQLCQRTGLTDKPVTRAIRELESAGLIEVVRGERGQHSIYSFPTVAGREAPENLQPIRGRKHRRNAGTQQREGTGETPMLRRGKAPEELRRRCRRDSDASTGETPTQYQNRNDQNLSRADDKPQSAHQAVITYFTDRWAALVGGGAAYPFSGGKDGAAVKRLLQHVNSDVDRATAVIDAYLVDDDSWLTEHGTGRSLCLLASGPQLTRYLAATAPRRDAVEGKAPPPQEHHLIGDVRTKWPDGADDVRRHREEYEEMCAAYERDGLGFMFVKRSTAKSAAEFREQFFRGASSNAAAS